MDTHGSSGRPTQQFVISRSPVQSRRVARKVLNAALTANPLNGWGIGAVRTNCSGRSAASRPGSSSSGEVADGMEVKELYVHRTPVAAAQAQHTPRIEGS